MGVFTTRINNRFLLSLYSIVAIEYLYNIGIGSWESAISGFNASEITEGERMFQQLKVKGVDK